MTTETLECAPWGALRQDRARLRAAARRRRDRRGRRLFRLVGSSVAISWRPSSTSARFQPRMSAPARTREARARRGLAGERAAGHSGAPGTGGARTRSSRWTTWGWPGPAPAMTPWPPNTPPGRSIGRSLRPSPTWCVGGARSPMSAADPATSPAPCTAAACRPWGATAPRRWWPPRGGRPRPRLPGGIDARPRYRGRRVGRHRRLPLGDPPAGRGGAPGGRRVPPRPAPRRSALRADHVGDTDR